MTISTGLTFLSKVKDMLLGVDSKLKRERHVRDNVVGMTADVAAHSASGFPVFVRYRRKDEQGTTAFKSMTKSLFKYEDEGSAPNLSGKVKIVAVRGY